jgi:hypothetical protein
MTRTAFEIQSKAYRAFERWQAEHDPDGEMDLLDASVAYAEWASKNSIAPYLDDAQVSCSVTRPNHLTPEK